MIKIKGGRKVLYQWDLNQSIVLDNAFAGAEIHFSDDHNTKDTCYVLLAYEENGQVFADIPNILLQKSGIVAVYVYTKKENEEHTEYFSELLVLPRKKPDDYVYTETEVKRWEDLEKKLKESVLYTPQTLAADQQEQARSNIAAASAESMENMEDSLQRKLDKPETPPTAAGKVLRVLSVNADGSFVCEWADDAIPSEIDGRLVKKAITPVNLDYAVKAAMCDGKGAAWTADEQAAAREMIGLGGDYEVLLDITVDEDCKSINVTTDANGNPFKLKEAFLSSYLPKSDKTGNYGMQLYYNQSFFAYAVTNAMSANSDAYSNHFAQLHNGLWIVGGTTYSQTKYSFTQSELYMGVTIKTKNDAPYIDKIVIFQLNSGTIKAGSTIKLMGVRA